MLLPGTTVTYFKIIITVDSQLYEMITYRTIIFNSFNLKHCIFTIFRVVGLHFFYLYMRR